MTVKQLIIELQKADPKLQVILQKDAEGNGYSPLRGVDCNTVYIPENTWSGEVYSLDDPHAVKSIPNCVVLHPIN